MVVALITAIALALTKGWFFNRNRNGVSNNNELNEKETEMKKDNSSSKKNGNTNKALKNAIRAVLDVSYNTTVGMGAGALLQLQPVSSR